MNTSTSPTIREAATADLNLPSPVAAISFPRFGDVTNELQYLNWSHSLRNMFVLYNTMTWVVLSWARNEDTSLHGPTLVLESVEEVKPDYYRWMRLMLACRHLYEVVNAVDYAKRRERRKRDSEGYWEKQQRWGDYCRLLNGNAIGGDELIDEDKELRDL